MPRINSRNADPGPLARWGARFFTMTISVEDNIIANWLASPWKLVHTMTTPDPDLTWGLDFDEVSMQAFIPALAQELDDRCKAVRVLYDNGSLDASAFNAVLEHVHERGVMIWREYCRRKHPKAQDGD